MKRTHYIYKLPLPGNVTFRICCGSWRGGFGSGGLNYGGTFKILAPHARRARRARGQHAAAAACIEAA